MTCRLNEQQDAHDAEDAATETVEKVLLLLGENPRITQRQLQTETGLTRRGVEWQLQRLKTDGRIRRIGPDKGGHWEVVADTKEHP